MASRRGRCFTAAAIGSSTRWITATGSGRTKAKRLAVCPTLAFHLSEIVRDLQTVGAHRQQIESLNEAFETCRHAAYDPTLFPSAKSHLAGVLEDIAATHSELTPETADFQSRLDEWARSRTDPDLPF